ncbi:NAD(P)-dependent oxidoreductase [Spongiactinospora rosea]|uniref:NAD(P)-dependent oxidoreductase n=1 Tax=Spongiactinospora rosea TaxID=2248750 RepID=A0A366LJJ8_9ACTN|nr:NAD(P)H-binding protein [Spongiactinospora rosea]RBQ14068.1 NAD(P)-dependent oxidoreductase [Spongiactinospora rosea]
MKITIVAATGGVGRHLLGQAIDAGHDVTAVVRNPAKLDREVRHVTTDLGRPDAAALEAAVAGADAVLSGLGSAPGQEGVAWRGTQAIVDAMRAQGTRRIMAISAAPVAGVSAPGRPVPRHAPGEGPIMRNVLTPLLRTILRKEYADLARMEAVLAGSDLDWTVVRPPQLTDKPATHAYRTALGANLPRGLKISRADLAHAMLGMLTDQNTIKQYVAVAY